MAYIDPWSGYQAGTQALAEAAKMSRQAELDAMAKQDWEFKKAAREQELADLNQQRAALREAAKPITTTSEITNPEYTKYQQGLGAFETAQYPQAPVERDMVAAGLASTPAQYAQQAMGPAPVETLKQTKTTAPSAWKQQIDAGKYLLAQGNPLGKNLVADATKSAYEEATKMLSFGDGEKAVSLINEATGSNLQYLGTKDGIQFVKGADGREYAFDPTVDRTLRAQGATLEQRLQASMKLVGEKPQAEWVTLPDVVKDGQTFIVEQNRLTGEKKYTKVSRDPSTNVNLTPREVRQGVVMSGPYAGLPAYKDSKGGAPFVYDQSGKKIAIPGVPLDQQGQAAAYVGTGTETGEGELTPAQKKANLKAQTDPTSMRIVKRIDGVVPVLQTMKTQFANLPNETGIVPLNKFLRNANVMLGNVKIDSYDTFVKETTREVQSALSGNQAAQALVMQQIDVLKSAKTNAQRAASMDAIINVLTERKKSELSVPYKGGSKTVVRTGTLNGKKVIQYSDGSTEYAQ